MRTGPGRFFLSCLTILIAVMGIRVGVADDGPIAVVGETLAEIRELRRSGEFDRALALADRLRSAHPDDLQAHRVYQDLRLARGERQALLEEYASRLDSPGASPDDRFLHARLLSGKTAIVALRRVLREEPDHFEAHCAIGAAYLHDGRSRLARRHLERARELRPGSAVPVNLLGWCHEWIGEAEEAEQRYREALALDPDFALPRVNLGILLVSRGRVEEGREWLREAREQAPGDPLPLLGLGLAHAAEGNPEEALTNYRAAAGLPDQTVDSLNMLGYAAMAAEGNELARGCFEKALERAPGDVAILINLAYVELMEERYEPAFERALAAREADPESAQAQYFVGFAGEYAGRADVVADAYRRATELDPENADYQRALGAFLLRLSRHREAIAAYREASRILDQSPESLLELAFAHVAAGEYRQAAALLSKVVEREPDHLEAWLNLGLVYKEKLGLRRRAMRAFAEYLDRGGTDPRVRNWLAELRDR